MTRFEPAQIRLSLAKFVHRIADGASPAVTPVRAAPTFDLALT